MAIELFKTASREDANSYYVLVIYDWPAKDDTGRQAVEQCLEKLGLERGSNRLTTLWLTVVKGESTQEIAEPIKRAFNEVGLNQNNSKLVISPYSSTLVF